MTVRAPDLIYPVLCLPQRMGVCVAKSAAELERCNAAVFWRGKFFEGLRLVSASGKTHEVVRAFVRRPATRLGQRLARFLELSISVEVEARPTTAVSMAEVRRTVEQAVEEDAEGFEEFSGKSVDWWKRSLAACQSIPDLMRTLGVARADVTGGPPKQYDVVRVTLLSENIDRDGWKINTRAPKVGDTGTVVEILEAEGHPDRYVVECVSPDGSTIWLAEFVREEIAIAAD